MASRAELAMILRARDEASRVLRNVGKEVGGLSSKITREFDGAARSVGNLGNQLSAFTAVATGALALAGGAAVKMAMDAVESENLFQVSMGDMAESARLFSERLRSELGLNATDIRKQVGTFNVMFTSMDVGKAAAYEMATGLTQLTQDMASFFNLKPDEAFQKLQAGITGEVEPLKRLGIVINETSVQQYALTQGLIKQGEEMSEAQKVVARYGLILERTSAAQGDLARTIDSPTNQLRIMQAQFAEIRKEVGDAFLPVVSTALVWLNDEGLPRVRSALKTLQDGWAEMSDEAKQRLIAIGVLLLAGGPVLRGISFSLQAVGLLAKSFVALKVVASGALGEIAIIAVATFAATWAFLAGIGQRIEDLGRRFRQDAALMSNVPALVDFASDLDRIGDSAIGTGLALQRPLAVGIDVVRKGLAEAGRVIEDGPLPAFDALTEKLKELGKEALSSFDSIIGFESAARNIPGVGDALDKPKAPDIKALFDQAAKPLEKLGSAAKGAGFAIGDIIKYLVSLHPASQAAASAVNTLKTALTGLEAAQKANSQAQQDAQETLRGMRDRVNELSTALSTAKARLDALSAPKLTGMTEIDDQIFQAEQQIKRIQLAKMGVKPSALGPLSKEAEAFVATLPKTEAGIRRFIEALQLQKSLNFDEQLREIAKAAKGAEKEMSFEDAIAAIAATKSEIGSLESQLATAEAAVRGQEAALRDLERAGAALTAQIQLVREQLRLQEEKQAAVNKALEIAFRWFVEDRQKLMELGGEAVTQAGVIDANTRFLLDAITEYAKNEAALAKTQIDAVVSYWESARARIAAIRAGLDDPGAKKADDGDASKAKAQGIGLGPMLPAAQPKAAPAITFNFNIGQVRDRQHVRELADEVMRLIDDRLGTQSYALGRAGIR